MPTGDTAPQPCAVTDSATEPATLCHSPRQGRKKLGRQKRGRKEQGRKNEDGFTIVWLAVTVTLLNIWIAATLPLWSFQIQRDKEADLIFRGLQIAEGIRVYLARTGQYPTTMKQMTEHEPRCLRQEWENPLREDGRWALIPVGTGGPGQGRQVGPDGRPIRGGNQGGRPGAQQGLPGQNGQGQGQVPGQGEREDGLPAGTILSAKPNQDGIGETPQTVAFRGVYHPGSEEGTRLFLDSEIISEWRFTVELISALRQGTPEAPLANPKPFLVEQIGRPWPPGVTPQVTMPTPDGQQGGNRPNPGGDGSGHPPVGDNRPPGAQPKPESRPQG